MEKLETMGAAALLQEQLDRPAFIVDGLIPSGLSVLGGSQKIGKSWLMLKLCLCVSKGEKLWDMETARSGVLYLCLEDAFWRIQDRLFRLTDEAEDNLRFAISSCTLTEGLINQLEEHMRENSDCRLIVIDTLQKIREGGIDNSYASDYGDLSIIKDFADRYGIAIIVVHHVRKSKEGDVFDRINGTKAITGSADTNIVLERENYGLGNGVLYATGRDIAYQEIVLRFSDCVWEFVERKTQEEIERQRIPPFLFRLVEFMEGKETWTGTATQLCTEMEESETPPNVITKWLNEYRLTFLEEHGIGYEYQRKRDGRLISLKRLNQAVCDGCVGCDG